MSKNWGKLFKSSVVTVLVAVMLGVLPISDTTANITYAENAKTSLTWSLEQYPDYYSVEGKSHINTDEFPKLYRTTEKVYKKGGRSTKHITVSDIQYATLDGYGRSGTAFGVITKDMINMSAGYREKWECKPEPSGWYSYFFKENNQRATESNYNHSPKTVSKVSNNRNASILLSNGNVRNGYLFDRSHLIADSLGGKPFRNNLVTGTRTQNVGNNDRKGGMQYIENKVLDYINKNPKVHVYYKAVPIYQGTELLPRFVLVSALSSDGYIDETVRIFNTANGFSIDYQNGGLLTKSPADDTTTGVDTDKKISNDDQENDN
ncbi:DNA/RNA non-specific endonuclease [Streptococcus castoreus]|uniref:DNA/RNA non-specific endonuclease n=1 Tax=Streptococcus castoreus TaxID=254786 RepID=UPI000419B4E4|nr:DNA/RNA non-specific endonuclease [Streptococcus castoreus]